MLPFNSDISRKVKTKLRNVLLNNNICAICLEETAEMYNFDDLASVDCMNHDQVPLSNIMKTVFGENTSSCSEKICSTCKKQVISAHSFIVIVQETNNIISKYIEQIESQLDAVQLINDDYSNIIINLQDFIPKEVSKDVFDLETNYEIESTGCEDIKETNDELKTNGNKNIKENIYICDICDKHFNNKKVIALHMTKAHMSQKCTECKTKDCVHIPYITSLDKPFKCTKCEYECLKLDSLIFHINKEHLNTLSSVCEHCGLSFYTRKSYKWHVRSHLFQSCEYCDKTFKGIMLEKHRNICREEKRQFMCDKCPASFKLIKQLAYHRRKHVAKFSCEKCSLKFTRESSYKAHVKKHFTSKTYTCVYCKDKFKTRFQRDRHKKTHIGENLNCTLCNLTFVCEKRYKFHIDTVQHKRKIDPAVKLRYQCTHCDYSTQSTDILEAHTNRYHLKITPYRCEICDRQFTGARLLNSHMSIIHKGRKIQCEVCGQYLGGPSNLKRHMRRHTGEKNVACQVCDEKFADVSLRNKHLTKKHSVKSVACPLCTSMFFSLSLMRGHFKKVHWKSNEKFDCRKVPDLKEEYYDLFRDRRRMVV